MIFDRFTQKCLLIRTSLIKFAARFYQQRSTSFSAGPPHTVCASFVCALSILYILLVLTYGHRILASSATTKGHVLVVCVIVCMRITSRMRINDLSAICDGINVCSATFSSPEPTLLLVSTKNRDLWEGPIF